MFRVDHSAAPQTHRVIKKLNRLPFAGTLVLQPGEFVMGHNNAWLRYSTTEFESKLRIPPCFN